MGGRGESQRNLGRASLENGLWGKNGRGVRQKIYHEFKETGKEGGGGIPLKTRKEFKRKKEIPKRVRPGSTGEIQHKYKL